MSKKHLLLALILTLLLACHTLSANTQSVTHTVKPGDNLSTIARRYHASMKDLRAWNGLKGDFITPGKILVVGFKKNIERNSDHSLREERKEISQGPTTLTVPHNYSVRAPEIQEYADDAFTLKIYAEDFKQSKVACLEIIGNNPELKPIGLRFNQKAIPLTRTSFGHRAIFGFDPEMRTGISWIVFSFHLNGRAGFRRIPLTIKPETYESYLRRVYLGDYSKPRPPLSDEQIEKNRQAAKERSERLARDGAKKRQAFARISPDQLSDRLSHPRGVHKVTSAFYVKRTVAGYYKKFGRVHQNPVTVHRHRGLDLRGRWGEPIYALAPGKIAIAEPMVFEGNFTVIDHGQGIFSTYMHQSVLLVKEGDVVSAGQLIGRAGNTGASLGPHLHLALLIRGVYYEPLSLLALPLRK